MVVDGEGREAADEGRAQEALVGAGMLLMVAGQAAGALEAEAALAEG